MSVLFDSKGNQVLLKELLGRGGEGAVFTTSIEGVVAKLYHERIDADKAEKLRWMAAHSDENLLKIAAWPSETLHTKKDGEICGFLMPKVNAKEIHELYSLKSRRIHFPHATWHFLVRTSANVARAFYALHSHGHSMGDVNHGNCVVLADGTVKLIDCDSFVIRAGDNVHGCDVGVTTHLPPELQGVNLRDVDRTADHDNFGLAVIIFQLMFLGRHPYSGNYLGGVDLSLEESIKRRLFAYSRRHSAKIVEQPPGTLALNDLPANVSELFEEAFLSAESRPSAGDWVTQLARLESELVECESHSGHEYHSDSRNCPWCRIESETGVMFFPLSLQKAGANGKIEIDVAKVEGLLAELREFKRLDVRSLVDPEPTPEILELSKTARVREKLYVSIYALAVTLMTILFGAEFGVFIAFTMLSLGILGLTLLTKDARNALGDEKLDLESVVLRAKESIGNVRKATDSDRGMELLENKIQSYKRGLNPAPNGLAERDIRATIEERLAMTPIESSVNSAIAGIRSEALEAEGIKSAKDISMSVLKPLRWLETDDRLKLLVWRKQLEDRFRSDLTVAEPNAKASRILEFEINGLYGKLKTAWSFMAAREAPAREQLRQARQRLDQIDTDLHVLGNTGPSIIALIVIAVMVPFVFRVILPGNFSGVLRSPAAEAPLLTRTDELESPVAPYETTVAPGLKIRTLDELGVPEDLYSDSQLERMSSEERSSYAKTLRKDAIDIIALDGDLEVAKNRLRYSMRMKESKEAAVWLAITQVWLEPWEDSLSDGQFNSKDASELIEGVKAFNESDFAEARARFNNITDPDLTMIANYFVGLIEHRFNSHDKSLAAYELALSKDPDFVPALLGKLNVQKAMKLGSEADATLETLRQVDPYAALQAE
ncbi:MAG: hypothetical protein R2684_07975 [Pyrinomonadaceae bacterium]